MKRRHSYKWEQGVTYQNGKPKKIFRRKRIIHKLVNVFQKTMKVIPKSKRQIGINCNQNGVAL